MTFVASKQRHSVPHADDARNAFDAGDGDVFRLDAHERRTVREELWAHPAADRRAYGQHAVANDPEHQRQEDESGRGSLDAEGDLTALLPSQPGRVLLGHLDRDLAAGVPSANDEY